MPKKARGRPPHRPCKLTPQVQETIVTWLQSGNYLETAAHLAGVNKQTIYTWLKRGQKEKSGEFRDFLDAVNKAQAGAEARLVMLLEKAATKNWQAAAWRLERKYPKRWGRRDGLELSGNKKKPINAGLSDETIATIREKVLGIKK